MKYLKDFSSIPSLTLRLLVLLVHLPVIAVVVLGHIAEGLLSAAHGFTTGVMGAGSVALQGFVSHSLWGIRQIVADAVVLVKGN